jgi:hypothetical protein
MLYAMRRTLAQRDGGLGFADLDTGLDRLQRQVNDAHELCCTAPRLEDLQVPAGSDLTDLVREVAVCHAAQVDATLRQRTRPSEAVTADWTITYHRHGGFIARAQNSDTDHLQPGEFHGYASTPLTAEDLLRQWFTASASLNVVFDPPPPDQATLAKITPESDLTGGFGGAQTVLPDRGPCYEQMRTTCARTRDHLRGVAINPFLAQRAQLLNDTDPQLADDPDLTNGARHTVDHHHGFLRGACWVPSQLVVSTGLPGASSVITAPRYPRRSPPRWPATSTSTSSWRRSTATARST